MDEDVKKEIALARYGVIVPLVNGTWEESSIAEYCRKASERPVALPNGKSRYYSAKTISAWYYQYRKNGFSGLMNKGRSDEGKTRVLDEMLQEQIRYMKENYPRITSTAIWNQLKTTGTEVSLSTVTRFVNQYLQQTKAAASPDMHRYELAHINTVWYGDTCYGPALKESGKKQRFYVIAVIDDASRLIVGADLFYSDSFLSVLSVLKSAVSKYGKPSVLTFDNGKSFRNSQMELLAARIGAALNFNWPRSPTQKAKIERWFRTCREQWMAELNLNDFQSLDELRKDFAKYIERYNKNPHSSLNGKSPEDRFFSEPDRIRRLSREEMDRDFLLEIERRVSSDNVIVIDHVEYEVPNRFSRMRIRLRYSPDMKDIYVVEADQTLTPIRLLNKQENAQIKREAVRFSGGEG